MVRAGFLNDNEYRQYPLIPNGSNTLNSELVVDCGFIMGLDSDFDPAQHVVYLAAVTKQGANLQIEFRTTAPAAASQPLVFTRTATSGEWAQEHVEAAPGPAPCALEPLWEGYLVTGPLNDVFAALNAGTTFTLNAQNAQVEPARVQTLAKSYLRSISVGNYARITTPPRLCDPEFVDVPPDLNYVIVNATCLTGDIKIEPGHYCNITQQNASNTLIFAAVKIENADDPLAGELCENGGEIKLYPLETKPLLVHDGTKHSLFYSGGLACNQTITSVNGLGGPNVKIVGGAGFQIVPDKNNPHTLKLQTIENIVTKTC